MKRKILLSLAAALMCGVSLTAATVTAVYDVIPLPHEVKVSSLQPFVLNAKTEIAYPQGNASLESNAHLLAGYLKDITGMSLKVTDRNPGANAIVLRDNLKSDNKEAYSLTVRPMLITIDGASPAGNFYGCQTLRKSLPGKIPKADRVKFPAVTINDRPRFGYRGGHFDVVRHFFPADSVKKFIDMLALHNANTMHWHLTDDQGWRIESKRFPRLHEIGSVRPGTCVGHDFDTSDSIPYGGYYTQDEIRNIVKYAAERHINIIPEIDLPGHMIAALKAYPNLGCTRGPYEVWGRWGVSEDLLCAGNDSTLLFLDGVLNEVMDLFPYEYIHAGGDECPKVRWEACPKCQARINALGLVTDDHSTKEQKLQTYVMKHASDVMAKRGRKMIGWDEIMEGGLPEGAVVMSWRGEEGGHKAAQLGHDAIMTPTNYCYLDYYQTLDHTGEPDAIGGYVPVEKVYSLEPIPASFSPEEAKHILGAQANLWTEYIPTFSQAMYHFLPRFGALCEVQWTDADKKDYTAFTHRLPRLMEHYKAMGLNYARHIFDVRGTLANNTEKGCIVATFEVADNAPIHYTLDGTVPTTASPLYTAPIELTKSCTIRAAAIRESGASKVFTDSVTFAKSTSRAITLANTPHSRYNGSASQLVDGRFGPEAFNTGAWLGFEGKDLNATIDLGEEMKISSVTVRNNVQTPDWIFDARSLTVEVSLDGQIYTEVAAEQFPQLATHKQEIVSHRLTFAPVSARYVRVKETCEMSIPEFHGVGAGKPAYIFVDEIVVD